VKGYQLAGLIDKDAELRVFNGFCGEFTIYMVEIGSGSATPVSYLRLKVSQGTTLLGSKPLLSLQLGVIHEIGSLTYWRHYFLCGFTVRRTDRAWQPTLRSANAATE
jgi:hypothetical protein